MLQPDRRHFLAGLLIAAPTTAAASTSTSTAPMPSKGDWPDFIRSMAFIHPNGQAAAINAMEAGMAVGDLSMISLAGLGDTPEHRLPILMFKPPGSRLRCFRPAGEDQ